MANTKFATGSVHNVLNWERHLNREVLKIAQFPKWFSSGADSAIKVIGDPLRGTKMDAAGDTVYTTLLVNLTGDGVSGDDNLQGQEEALVMHRQTVTINQLRQAVISDGRMTNQRTFARQVLQKWGADTLDLWACNQLGGISSGLASNNKAGMQTPTAPTSTSGNSRILYGPITDGFAKFTTEASLSVSHTADKFFRVTMLDEAVAAAETATPSLEPVQTANGPKYIAVLHPFQIMDLRSYAGANQVNWFNYASSVVEGGSNRGRDLIGSPLRGALGEYNNVLIFSDSRIPLATSLTRVRRAIFMCAQAGTLAFGADSAGAENLRFRYDEQEEDYKNRIGIGLRLIGGMVKNVYNSLDHGVIVMSSYAAAA